MKVGPRRANGGQNSASIARIQENVALNGAALALARGANAARAGNRPLEAPHAVSLPSNVHLNREKFLPLRKKLPSPREKFLPNWMKLREIPPDADLPGAAAAIAGVSVPSDLATSCAIQADVASLHAAVPSPQADLRPRTAPPASVCVAPGESSALGPSRDRARRSRDWGSIDVPSSRLRVNLSPPPRALRAGAPPSGCYALPADGARRWTSSGC